MKTNLALKLLIPLIFILTLTAVLAGLWPGEGEPYSLTNFRGEAITINARGLYYWDTVSSAAQMQANDLVMLVLGLPLLAISFWMTLRGSLRGRLLLTGTLGFILYTYITMCFGTAYNKFFLVYVAMFSLSLFAFILSMMSFDLKTLPAQFSEKLPRRGIAALLYFAAAFLTLAWLGRIAPTLSGTRFLSWKTSPACSSRSWIWGLSSRCVCSPEPCSCAGSPGATCWPQLGLLKFLTMGIAVALMGLNMARVGVPVSAGMLVVFSSLALVNLVMVMLLLKNIND